MSQNNLSTRRIQKWFPKVSDEYKFWLTDTNWETIADTKLNCILEAEKNNFI